MVFSKLVIKERKKPEKCLLPHGRPSDDRAFAFSSRVPSKAAKIKALINYGIIRQESQWGKAYCEWANARVRRACKQQARLMLIANSPLKHLISKKNSIGY
jgi:hypothetical protein